MTEQQQQQKYINDLIENKTETSSIFIIKYIEYRIGISELWVILKYVYYQSKREKERKERKK